MLRLSQKARLFLWQIILVAGVMLLTLYTFYRASFINFSPLLAFFSVLLFIAETHTIFHLYGMFYSLWPRNYKKYSPNMDKNLRINMFICVCGEPADVVRKTIQGAKDAVSYYVETVHPKYKPQIYVLNDGRAAKRDNWKEIIALAKSMGVKDITRIIPGGYKAGNINNALKVTKTSDPFNTLDVVFDSDFAAKKIFLTEMTKPFADQTVDFAQSPQRYANEKGWVSKAAAAHQIYFFDHICAAKGHDNALFLCGTNFAIRRSALNAIGGMDTRYITEDYATSLELHLSGHRGVYVPKVLAIGMAPTSLKQYFSQQQRWSKGSLDVSRDYFKRIVFGPMTWRQKFHYLLSASYYLIGMRDFILMLAPLPYLLWGVSLIRANTWYYLILVYAPLVIFNFILYLKLFKHPVKSLVLDIASFPVFVAAFLSAATKRDLSFIVTIKKYERENPFQVYKLQLLTAGVLFVGLSIGLQHNLSSGGAFLNFFWASYDALILSLGFYLIIRENYNTAKIEKFFFKGMSMMPRIALIILLIGIAVITGYFITNPNALKAQLNSLASFASDQASINVVPPTELLVPDKGFYYGYYQPSLDTHPQTPVTTVVSGEKTSLVMFYQDWSDSSFDSRFMKTISAGGNIPIITWEPWNSNDNYPAGMYQEKYSLRSIIDGQHDDFLRQWARSAKIYGQPFFLRFAHEMNGNWYPWGSINKPETYVATWRHVHDIFESEGATNVIWLWSPNNTDANGQSTSILEYYPGDNYVDWVGFSGFNWGTTSNATRWQTFRNIAGQAYPILATLNKPIMVSETSTVSVGGDKNKWFRDLLIDLTDYPRIKGIIFFDQNINGADFSLQSGVDFEKIANEEIVNNEFFIKSPILKTN